MNEMQRTSAPSDDAEYWELRLYVAGQTDKSIRAVNNLTRICKEHLEGRYSIEVIDLLQRPAACGRRPDSRGADTRAAAAGADQENHRRPLKRGTRARGARYPPAEGMI